MKLKGFGDGPRQAGLADEAESRFIPGRTCERQNRECLAAHGSPDSSTLLPVTGRSSFYLDRLAL
jgi:hypothetical protein